MSNIKLKYIYSVDSYLDAGVINKINDQINEFIRNGIDAQVINMGFVSKMKRIFPFASASHRWSDFNTQEKIDVLYIRYTLADKVMLKMLKEVKTYNPKVKVIIEIPTYPYSKEYKIKHVPILLKDVLNRRHLKEYVDRIVTFSDDKQIFGIPTINAMNGISFKRISQKETIVSQDGINLIAVSTMHFWHGYDRLLIGMSEYYKKDDVETIVHLHMVGEGIELENYKKIVNERGIGDYVTFYGLKTKKELDEIYNKCDIAVGVFGAHRKGIYRDSSLKSREYLAKGLPIVTSCKIDVIDSQDYPFVLYIQEGESTVNTEKIIKFHKDVYADRGKRQGDIISEIREYGFKLCDISITMKPLIEHVISG